MGSEKIAIQNFTLDYYRINTLVVGSGVAALNAAVSLHAMGQEDILIATTQWGGGTSNNAGSDKQTYYKLSLSGNEPDSVPDMARDLFEGKCMHGDIALCEAQGSVQSFFNLVNLGVEFPHDKYGSWAGYKTDHDPRSRATSAVPYTSRRMFEALAGEVKKRNIEVLDNHQCVALLTDKTGSKVLGALAINKAEKDYTRAFVLFNSTNVILGTGGPGGIYDKSVYPLSQNGSIGMAFTAGATGQNLTESQFGIASVKFRWNLSGSYQQVISRYISNDYSPIGDKEFFNETGKITNDTLSLALKWKNSVKSSFNKKYLAEIQKRMSESGGLIRNRQMVEDSSKQAAKLLNRLPDEIGADSVTEMADAFSLIDNCISHFIYLSAIRVYIEKGGRSRGSYIIMDGSKQGSPTAHESIWKQELCIYDREIEKKILEVTFRSGSLKINLADVREIPKQDLWFERVWKEYIEDIYFDC